MSSFRELSLGVVICPDSQEIIDSYQKKSWQIIDSFKPQVSTVFNWIETLGY
jgi:hypothetical protein